MGKKKWNKKVGTVTVGEPVDGECGKVCWKVSTNARSRKDPKWYISTKKRGAGNLTLITSGPSGDSKSLETELCLDPAVHKKGKYWVVVRVYGPLDKWRWSKYRIDFNPNPQPTLHLALDENPEYNVGKVECTSPLRLSPIEQDCMSLYKVGVRRVHNGVEVGSRFWLEPNWTAGPVPDLDLRALAAERGYDFVPGQCYKVDVFSKFHLNGGPWTSAGHVFCIAC